MMCHVYLKDKLGKEAITEMIATIEKFYGTPSHPEAMGLYVISNHIGARDSIAFWEDVIKNGPAFANPELFPWTLANSVCGFIARHFGINGPNYTYTCPPEDQERIHEVLKQAEYDRQNLGLSNVWVIVVH